MTNVDEADRAGTHVANGYRVRVKTGPGVEFSAGPDPGQYYLPPPLDVRVELDAQVLSGKALVGVSCRHTQLGRNFTEYHMTVGTDGTYSVEAGPPYRSLASGAAAGALRPGANRIRGDCIGTTLTLSVNGQQLATAQDSQLTGRLNGIFIRSLDAAGAEVLLSNLRVSTP